MSVTDNERTRIKVSCDNCYRWRQKCNKKESKLEKLQAELDRVKLLNMELTNKLNVARTANIINEKQMNRQLNEYEELNMKLKQENENALNHVNDLKVENERIKAENIELRQENKQLNEDVTETKKHGEKLLVIINKLRDRVVQIETHLHDDEDEDDDDGETTVNNKDDGKGKTSPWYWVGRLT